MAKQVKKEKIVLSLPTGVKNAQAGKANAVQKYRQMVEPGFAKRYALAHSPYLSTLLDPWNCPGVKIPDENTAPSFTFQTVSKVALNTVAGAGGSIGIGVGYQLANSSTGAVISLTPGAAAGTYTAASVGSSTSWFTQVAANCMQVRPVSAGLSVSSAASTLTDNGRIYVAYLPPGEGVISPSIISLANLATAPTAFRQTAFAADVPVAKRFARVIWLPIDEIARMYTVPGAAVNAFRPPTGTTTYGCVAALVDGATATTEYEFNLVVNWEALPINSLTNILQATPSASDPLELAAAANVISAHPTLAQMQVPAETAVGTSSAPGMRSTPQYAGPSFLDKVLSGLGKGVDIAKTVAPAVASAIAML